MPDKSRPRTGSLQYYPRSRAKKETPIFHAYASLGSGNKTKALNFYGYKAGMVQVGGKDTRKATPSSGHDIVFSATVIECPPIKVLGVRAFGYNQDGRTGTNVLTEVWADKADRHVQKKLNFKQTKSKKKKDHVYKTIADLEKIKGDLTYLRLLVATQPGLTNFGKKRPDVAEIGLSGTLEEQLSFAKEKLGGDLHVKDVFDQNGMVDIKAVSTGKGMQGVIKRHNVKIQRHKAKKQRVVGSIGPWHPPTVMWTVARAGQMGYNSRTEFNKKILMVGDKGKAIAPSKGFSHYGTVQNEFLLVAGSIPGPAKRCVAIRLPVRPSRENRIKLDELSFISTVTQGKAATEETPKAAKADAKGK